jgi:hypothetical protein
LPKSQAHVTSSAQTDRCTNAANGYKKLNTRIQDLIAVKQIDAAERRAEQRLVTVLRSISRRHGTQIPRVFSPRRRDR